MAHSHEFIGGVVGRIDKVDLLFRMEYDRWQAELGTLTGLMEQVKEATGNGIGCRVRCYGAEKDTGLRIYGVSTWGVACDDFLQLLPLEYHSHISRVDYRVEQEITVSQLAVLKQQIEENNPKHRNVTEYNTRTRNKEFARNGGGRGLAFGSHKSDVRLTAYKRSGETGAVEIQVSGDSIQGILLYAQQLQVGEQSPSIYAAVCDGIVSKLYSLVKEMGFEEPTQLLAMLGESDYKLTYAENEERKLIDAKTAFDNLAPETQLDFFSTIRAEVISQYNRLQH